METGKDEVAVEIQDASTTTSSPALEVELPTLTGPILPTSTSLRYRNVSGLPSTEPKSRILEPVPPKSPLNGAPPAVTTPTPVAPVTGNQAGDDDEEEDDADVYKAQTSEIESKKNRRKKRVVWFTIECIFFVLLMALLICSLLVNYLKSVRIWSIYLWRWCVLALVIFCGHIFTEFLINAIVILITRVFLLKRKVAYFLFAMKDSIQVDIWLSLILVAWALIINSEGRRSVESARIHSYIERVIVSTLVGAVIWTVKTFLVKLEGTRFHVRTYFDRIQESIFHQYILQALSGILNENETGHISFRRVGKGSKEQLINVNKLCKMKRENISSWTMGGLIQLIRNSGLPTHSVTDDIDEEENNSSIKDIESEAEAINSANRIFSKLAKPGSKYIEVDDLLAYMKREEVIKAIPLFEGAAETRMIKRSSFRKFVLKAYRERKFLAYSLNDSKTAIEELNKLSSAVVLVVIIIVWLLIMQITTNTVLLFIFSQFLLVSFIFGNSLKTVFESLIFVFIVHPFDVGDRCEIDGVQMTVDEMNIMTTIFLKSDNQKVYYPNSQLAMKPIGNFNRSPEMMSDSVEFAIDFSTPLSSIAALKEQIKKYVESKPKHWSPSHSVQINEIVNMDKMILGLHLTHTINFQNSERGSRKSDLILELKRILEDLQIKYRLLHQEVHVKYIDEPRS